MKKIAVMIFVSVILLASAAHAQIPKSINYQGVLTDGTEVVVPDGSYQLDLRLYTVASGGSPVWSCTETVTVSKGIFNAVLGNSCVLALDFSEQYYLGISVEGEAELTPRTPLSSSAYSLSSLSVAGVENVFPSDGNVGIGTTTPPYRLTIHGNSQVGIRYNGYDSSWSSIYTNGAAGGRPTYGYMRNNVLIATTYLDPGATWHLRFSSNDVFNISSLGHTGIGAGIYPGTEMLTVGGAVTLGNSETNTTGALRWTGSDFEGYDGSAWQSLTGSGGSLPAGTVNQTLRHTGSEWTASEALTNNGTVISLGSVTQNGYLDVYQNGVTGTPVIELTHDGTDGGSFNIYDGEGYLSGNISNDSDGEGGYMHIRRSSILTGFCVDGNYNGTNNTSVAIKGTDRQIIFNTNNEGDDSAVFPSNAIASEEILDETGAASNGEDASTIIVTDPTTILSRSITVPAAGYVLVMASTQLTIIHTYGDFSRAEFGVSASSSSWPNNQDIMVGLPDVEESGYYHIPVSPHGLFEVGSAGTYTYYFLGDLYDAGASITAWDSQLTLVYIPTSYGTVTSTLISDGNASEDPTSARPGKTPVQIAAERTASIADNNARIQRELDRMQAEIEELKRELKKSRD